jgi:heavy metal translocating P-type ATPase
MIPALMILGGLLYAGYSTYAEGKAKKDPQAKNDPVPKNAADTQIKKKPVTPVESTADYAASEEGIRHYLKVSGAALGTATLGAVLYPPLQWVTLPLLLYCCIPVFKNAFRGIMVEKRIRASMVDTIAIVGTYGTGYYIMGSLGTLIYFWGSKMMLQTEDRSKNEIVQIFNKKPQSVWLLVDGVEVAVPFESLKLDDVIVVQAGEVVPIDGTIMSGMAAIDQHMLTGEAQPVEKDIGDTVLAATLVINGKIQVKVTHAASDTSAAQIANILQNTTDFKLSIEAKTTQIADMMALPTVAVGGLTLVFMGPVSATAVVTCNFMEITRVNIPFGVLNYLRVAYEKGILVKDGRCLELLHEVDTIVFDKTGTLTLEEPRIGNIHVLDGLSADEILCFAAAAEHKQTHPVAKAVLRYARTHHLTLPEIENAQYNVGYGIHVKIDQQDIHVGSDRFMVNESVVGLQSAKVLAIREQAEENGHALLYVSIDQVLTGMIELQVALRPEAKAVIDTMKSRGINPYIISGDQDAPTRRLAQELGVEHYFSEVLPQDKARIIQELRNQGKSICFVGDGINDTVALKTANVSVSIHGASTAAIDTAGVVLMDGTLNHLISLFDLSYEMEKNIRRGFGTALIPGAIGVAGVFLMNFTVNMAILLSLVSLGTGTLNAVLPLLQHRQQRSGKHQALSSSNSSGVAGTTLPHQELCSIQSLPRDPPDVPAIRLKAVSVVAGQQQSAGCNDDQGQTA